MEGPITVVGITDQGRESLLPEALSLVAEAEVLCGGERHLGFFPDHAGERIAIKGGVQWLVERLRAETRPTVVLASGDPCCFGIGPLLAEQLGAERVRILPNVGSVQMAFARLGLAWHDAAILSAHGRALDSILPAALIARKVAILTDGQNTPSAIAQALLDAGDEDEKTTVDVFEHLSGAAERHVTTRLRELVGQDFAPLNIVVIRRNGAPRRWPLGVPESAFAHRAGMITKAEVRAVTLAKLRLHEGATLWDVGAGCGSVAIEAGALLPGGRVCAVERDPAQLAHLETNRRRFAAGNVCVVPGEAPDALADLPDPHVVFLGGSGGQLEAILEASAARLRANGRIVANVVAFEHLDRLRHWASVNSWPVEITQISVARSVGLTGARPRPSSLPEGEGAIVGGEASLTRLDALNPVFIVTLEQPAR